MNFEVHFLVIYVLWIQWKYLAESWISAWCVQGKNWSRHWTSM